MYRIFCWKIGNDSLFGFQRDRKTIVIEVGSAEVQGAVAESETNATAVMSRAAVAAAFKKSVRAGALRMDEAEIALGSFNQGWRNSGTVSNFQAMIRK